MTTDTQPMTPTDAELDELIAKEMLEYSDGAYADHGSARSQLEHFARAIESEVRKQDTELIRQLVEALEQSHATLWEEDDDPSRPAHAAITAGRARLEAKK